jgi:hypothetical protein
MPFNLDQITIFGSHLININSVSYLLLKLLIDLFFTLIIVRCIFYPIYKERDYVFTSILINISVFLICFLLGSIKVKIGFAFGLFAVFSMLRYRTEQIEIRQMTYMFVVIIIAVLNALSDEEISFAEQILANSSILIAVFLLEKNFLHDREFIKLITYEKIDLIKPENYEQLITDLINRTGLNIKRAEIESINFLNDTAKLKILFSYPDNTRIKKDLSNEKKAA